MVSFNLALLGALTSATVSLAHMQMSWPYPFKSSFNPANSYTDIGESILPRSHLPREKPSGRSRPHSSFLRLPLVFCRSRLSSSFRCHLADRPDYSMTQPLGTYPCKVRSLFPSAPFVTFVLLSFTETPLGLHRPLSTYCGLMGCRIDN